MADNRSAWFIAGVSDTRRHDAKIHLLNRMDGSSFEVVDAGGLVDGR
jgi:hypothetical protein